MSTQLIETVDDIQQLIIICCQILLLKETIDLSINA